MKGSQGLDALATLCNGASKVLDNDNNRKTDNSNQTIQASPMNTNVTGTQAQATISQQLEQLQNPSVSLNGGAKADNNSAQPQQGQGFNQMNSQVAALLNAGLPQQNVNKFPNNNDSNAMALQQMVYLNLLQNQNVSNMITPQPQAAPQFVDQNALAVILALQQQQQQQAQQEAGHHFAQLQQQHDQQQQQKQQQQQQQQKQQQQQQQPQFHAIIPPPSQPNQTTNVKKTNNNAVTQSSTFPAPRPKVKSETTMMENIAGTPVHQPILMRHPQGGEVSNVNPTAPPANEAIEPSSDSSFNPEDKKLMKRAANRRSAQLSRKRKKQYIEDLKEENADLRRMELILRSIPDLVISFDSSGKIGFVSQSVSNFLSFTPEELEGRSFWERLCQDSVRLLKAAFMDALAARENDSTSTPLGTGVWELRLQDKNKEIVMVTLNGVVHFTGDAPECVCSIRLCGGKQVNAPTPMKPIALPQQSVFNNKLSVSQDKQPEVSHKKPRVSAQISDIDTGSSCNDE